MEERNGSREDNASKSRTGFHLREQGIRDECGLVPKLVRRGEEFVDGEVQRVVGRKENVGDVVEGHKFCNIIHVKDIIRPCHLVPKIGAKVDCSWTSDSVYKLARTFFVNDFIDLDFFFHCSGIQY